MGKIAKFGAVMLAVFAAIGGCLVFLDLDLRIPVKEFVDGTVSVIKVKPLIALPWAVVGTLGLVCAVTLFRKRGKRN